MNPALPRGKRKKRERREGRGRPITRRALPRLHSGRAGPAHPEPRPPSLGRRLAGGGAAHTLRGRPRGARSTRLRAGSPEPLTAARRAQQQRRHQRPHLRAAGGRRRRYWQARLAHARSHSLRTPRARLPTPLPGSSVAPTRSAEVPQPFQSGGARQTSSSLSHHHPGLCSLPPQEAGSMSHSTGTFLHLSPRGSLPAFRTHSPGPPVLFPHLPTWVSLKIPDLHYSP
jgi:hypothetical protein